MSEPARPTGYGARMTACKCGHPAVEHYDSYDICTWTLGDEPECDCQRFEAAGLEMWVSVGQAGRDADAHYITPRGTLILPTGARIVRTVHIPPGARAGIRRGEWIASSGAPHEFYVLTMVKPPRWWHRLIRSKP